MSNLGQLTSWERHILPTDGQAELAWVAGYVDSLPTRRQSLTGLDVEQLR